MIYQDDGTVARTALQLAASKAGSPYVWGAGGPNSFDCSGFVHWCYSSAGLPGAGNPTSHLWNTATLQFMGERIPNGQEQPGDLVLPEPTHVGICAGSGKFWEAPHTGDVVKLASYGKVWMVRRIATPSGVSSAGGSTVTVGAVTQTSFFSGIAGDFNFITSGQGWIRIVEVLFGAALIYIALEKVIGGRK